MRDFYVYANGSPATLVAVVAGCDERFANAFFDSTNFSVYNGPLAGGSAAARIAPQVGQALRPHADTAADGWHVAWPATSGSVLVVVSGAAKPQIDTAFRLLHLDSGVPSVVAYRITEVEADDNPNEWMLRLDRPLGPGGLPAGYRLNIGPAVQPTITVADSTTF